MSYNYNSAAYQIFRGINQADKTVDKNTDTTIMDAANDFQEDNKTNLTVALEDFSDKFKSFHGKNSSNITADDAKAKSFLFFKKDPSNIYESESAQEYLKENENLFQNDIYKQALKADGGIQYSEKSGVSLDYEAALNFAKADIGAIETALSKVHDGGAKTDGKLNYAEAGSYVNASNIADLFEEIDLDGDVKTISAEEYASYLVAADGLISFGANNENQGFAPNSPDGLINSNEAQIAKQMSNNELKGYAQQIYSEHFEK